MTLIVALTISGIGIANSLKAWKSERNIISISYNQNMLQAIELNLIYTNY